MIQFLPTSFKIPTGIETENFKIRILTVNDLIKDYDAVMSSVDHLKGIFGPSSSWPSEDLTIEQNLIDLGWHQKEFENRSSFAYTVMNLNESKCLGCLYIEPSEKVGFDAKSIFWVRESEIVNGLDEKLFDEIKIWFSKEWRFRSVAFPGRLISWRKWDSIPDK